MKKKLMSAILLIGLTLGMSPAYATYAGDATMVIVDVGYPLLCYGKEGDTFTEISHNGSCRITGHFSDCKIIMLNYYPTCFCTATVSGTQGDCLDESLWEDFDY